MVRFIHAADIHLDSPLVGLSRYEGAPVELLRTATRSAFSALVESAIEEAVDFVVIAGDLYDGDWRDYNTGLYFCREMGKLDNAGIPVFLAYGNHDARSEITRRLRLPRNVHAFSDLKPQTYRLEEHHVALHGQSFRTAATTENLAAGYPAPVPGWLNIGVLHTALDGHAAHDPYAPCAVAELVARGYDYWALGHVHEYAVRNENPWIVFPGNLQGRHIREQGERGAVLVTAAPAPAEISIERCCVDVLRWYHLYVDAGPAANLDAVVERIGRHLEPLVRQQSDGRALAVRVTVRGRCAAHGELFGAESRLRAEVLAYANAIGGERLWIEKVCLDTTPSLSSEELVAREDALADLHDFLADAAGNPEFLQTLERDLRALLDRCPGELFAAVPELEMIRQGRLQEITRSVAPSVLAQLVSGR